MRWSLNELKRTYRSVIDGWSRYIDAYGGSLAILVSPYVHFALLLNIVCVSRWTADGWWRDPIDILPGLLGFTLGALVILTSWVNVDFVRILSKKEEDEKSSIYESMLATVVHFVLMQAVALVFAIVAQAGPLTLLMSVTDGVIYEVFRFLQRFLWFWGHFLFIYSVLLSIAAVFAVFKLAGWSAKFNDH